MVDPATLALVSSRQYYKDKFFLMERLEKSPELTDHRAKRAFLKVRNGGITGDHMGKSEVQPRGVLGCDSIMVDFDLW